MNKKIFAILLISVVIGVIYLFLDKSPEGFCLTLLLKELTSNSLSI